MILRPSIRPFRLTSFSPVSLHTHTAEDLQAQAGMFKKNATTLKKQMWWKQLRMKMVLGLAILAILLVIIIPIAVTGKRFYNANKKNKN